MSSVDFDPLSVTCPDWKKIYPPFRVSGSSEQCSLCGKRSSTKCSGCWMVSYCCTDHQKKHWRKEHKNKCCPFKLARSPTAGRYVVATRDLKAGDIITEEQPITAGPKQFTQPICLGCYKIVDGSYNCSECRWPMCGPECERRQMHRRLECPVFKESKFRPKVTPGCPVSSPIYECVTPLRCYLVQFLNENNWNVMCKMEQHKTERRNESFYEVNQTNTVNFLLSHMTLPRRKRVEDDGEEKEASDEELGTDITSMIDVLDVNAFEIRGPEFSIRGVFPLTAMMNSVCSPNTQNCIDSDFTCRVRAVRDIPKGEEVTTSYTLTLAGTKYRRNHLKESKYFECTCSRCEDPTELGSHFSTLLCPDKDGCPGGLVTSSEPLNAEAKWGCNACKETSMTSEEVSALTAKHEQAVEELPLEADALEDYLTELESVFHRNHSLCLDLKFTLVQCLGRERKGDDQMLLEGQKKQKLCKEVLAVMDMVVPGRFRMRGMFLFELYVVSLYLLKREEGRLSRSETQKRLLNLREVLEECLEILSYEPEETLEGQRFISAEAYWPRLGKMIKAVS